MYYTDGTLGIEDLNPEMKTRWKMTRWEMLMLGVKCVWASIRG
jgi:hypothetical protein